MADPNDLDPLFMPGVISAKGGFGRTPLPNIKATCFIVENQCWLKLVAIFERDISK